jgi:tetratricopeptide (TPR) repeat protein
MPQELIDKASILMKAQQFDKALLLLHRALDTDPTHWGAWYMAGQCCRFLNDIDGAIEHLLHAAEISSDEPPVFLALGIALQLRERWDEAVEAFRQAIAINPDYELAYNSLALTQKKRGEFNEALYNYDAGAKALARRIGKAMQNSPTSPIHKHRELLVGTLWIEYVGYAALYLACTEGISGIAWLTGEQAEEEEQTEKHGGLYWIDVLTDKKKPSRLFLPNYFNTFVKTLREDGGYGLLMGNRGTVFKLLGDDDSANQHFNEARDFSSTKRS